MLIIAIVVIVAFACVVGWQVWVIVQLRALLVRERDYSREMEAKYQRLVDDLKTLAMRPQIAVAHAEGPKRARSTAELRKMFDQENAKVLADRDQSR